MVDFSSIIGAVFALIAAVVMVVVPYIRSGTTARQRAELGAWARAAAPAAVYEMRQGLVCAGAEEAGV